MGSTFPADHPIFHGSTKHTAGKGDLGEAICMSILKDCGLHVENLNQKGRNVPGIDLLFIDSAGSYLSPGSRGVVQCRGGIRNLHNSRLYNRPECDGVKIDNPKIKSAEAQAILKNADLFFSIAYLYPQNEDETALFFFLATDAFMKRYCSESYGYRFWTHRILEIFMPTDNAIPARVAEGLQFRIYMFNTSEVMDLKDVSEGLNIGNTVELTGDIAQKRLVTWRSWREFDGISNV